MESAPKYLIFLGRKKKEFSDFSVFGVGFQIEIDLFEAQNKNL